MSNQGERRFRRAITYGTFDLLHYGHLNLLRRIADLADEVVVGVSTDGFNEIKGKRSMTSFEHRSELVAALRMVSRVIPEESWDQKRRDIVENGIDLFVMGDDWVGKFDELGDVCEVMYLPRTSGISSTMLRDAVHLISSDEIDRVLGMLKSVAEVLRPFGE
jgi:glycerol-3-phosphate cytidylyltransferase